MTQIHFDPNAIEAKRRAAKAEAFRNAQPTFGRRRADAPLGLPYYVCILIGLAIGAFVGVVLI